MAHLNAAREEDGFFGLGYATAEDRLEQVLLLYLGVKGELAAAFGPGPIGADKVGALSRTSMVGSFLFGALLFDPYQISISFPFGSL